MLNVSSDKSEIFKTEILERTRYMELIKYTPNPQSDSVFYIMPRDDIVTKLQGYTAFKKAMDDVETFMRDRIPKCFVGWRFLTYEEAKDNLTLIVMKFGV